jgi:hypothetical protein
MAMNKKEQAAMQARIDRAETLAALRWTSLVQRDVGVPKDGYSQGWDYNANTQAVWIGWSSSVSHGKGMRSVTGRWVSGSQNPRAMFSTKALALAAMRHEIELKVAADLLKIDRQIAAALDTGSTETA